METIETWWWLYTWHTATKATYIICYFKSYVNVLTKESAQFFFFAFLQLISKGIDWKSLLLEISVCRNSSLAGTMFKMCGIHFRFSFDPIKSFINRRTFKEKPPNFQGGSSAELSNVFFVKKKNKRSLCFWECACCLDSSQSMKGCFICTRCHTLVHALSKDKLAKFKDTYKRKGKTQHNAVLEM